MDTDITLDSIRVTRADQDLDIEVTLLVRSKLGEMRFPFLVEQVTNLHDGVERARKRLHQFANDLAHRASAPIFGPTS